MRNIKQEILKLKNLREHLLSQDVFEKLNFLSDQDEVKHMLKKSPILKMFMNGLSVECEIILKTFLAIGEAQLFCFADPSFAKITLLRDFLQMLMKQDALKWIDFHLEILKKIQNERTGPLVSKTP